MSLRENPLFQPRRVTTARELRALESAFPGSRPVTRIHLLAPTAAGQKLADQYGIECGKFGANFAIDSDTDLTRIPQELLPFFARPVLTPFLSDIAPNNSWGSSLGALVTSASMKPQADIAERKYGDKCYLCGVPRMGAKAPAHHPRAWWGYGEPEGGDLVARQFLLALTPMCRDCTDTLQLARDYDAPRKAAARDRLARTFRYTASEVAEYEDFVQRRAERRGTYMWQVDLSRVFSDSTLCLQAAWDHRSEVGIEQPVVYRAASPQTQAASLMLCGVKYTLTGTHRVHFYR